MIGELGPLVDHHCHGLVLDDLDRPAFEALLNEAARPAAAGTTFFDSLLGLAVRRWCAPVLDLPVHAPPEDYLERRRELGPAASRRLLVASGIEEFFVDTGLPDPRLCSAAEVADLAGGTAYEVLRLETLAEDLLASGVPADGLPDRIEQALRETTAVAFKSVAAYRVGLDLPVARPSKPEVVRALKELAGPSTGSGHPSTGSGHPSTGSGHPSTSSGHPSTGSGHPSTSSGHGYRIAHPVVHAWLAWTAIEIGRPLQIHVGYGDADLDLRRADPLRLTGFLRATEERGVPVLLLHNYPFQRQAAYLAQVFQHVQMDVGLAVHNSGALSRAVIAETLELVPFAKLLFSTDAYGLAELYHLGALLFRRGLAALLGDLVADGEVTADDAERLGALVARENARRVYRF